MTDILIQYCWCFVVDYKNDNTDFSRVNCAHAQSQYGRKKRGDGT